MSDIKEFISIVTEMQAKIDKLEQENTLLKKQLREKQNQEELTPAMKEEKLKRILWGFGLSMNYSGYRLIIESVLICSNIKGHDISLTKQVYIEVGRKYMLSPSNVDRNIRTLRDKMMERPERLEKLLGYTPLKKPHPKDIIAALARKIEN